MSRLTHCLLGALMLTGGGVLAKLPPLTPEEQAVMNEKKAQQELQIKREAASLEKAQDRIANQYKRTRGRTESGARTDRNSMPKTTGDTPGGTGPTRDRPVSGEAHSAPAK